MKSDLKSFLDDFGTLCKLYNVLPNNHISFITAKSTDFSATCGFVGTKGLDNGIAFDNIAFSRDCALFQKKETKKYNKRKFVKDLDLFKEKRGYWSEQIRQTFRDNVNKNLFMYRQCGLAIEYDPNAEAKDLQVVVTVGLKEYAEFMYHDIRINTGNISTSLEKMKEIVIKELAEYTKAVVQDREIAITQDLLNKTDQSLKKIARIVSICEGRSFSVPKVKLTPVDGGLIKTEWQILITHDCGAEFGCSGEVIGEEDSIVFDFAYAIAEVSYLGLDSNKVSIWLNLYEDQINESS